MHLSKVKLVANDPSGCSFMLVSFMPSRNLIDWNQIKAVVVALRNTRGLPWQPAGYKKKPDEDILDWLQVMFGFQKDNVANQREHLILLLANVHIRQFSKPDQPPKLDE